MIEDQERERLQAAIFDFDGFLFQNGTSWKIINRQLGVLGSRLAWPRACSMFEGILQENPGARITDYFAIDEYEFQHAWPESGFNILPMISLFQTAQSHLARNRDLFIISFRNYRGLSKITEKIYEIYRKENPEKFRWLDNPFHQAREISPVLANRQYSREEGMFTKMELLSSMIAYQDVSIPEHKKRFQMVNPEGLVYDKIFYYYSEPRQRALMEAFIQREKSLLRDGRNALVPFFIAEADRSAGGRNTLPGE